MDAIEFIMVTLGLSGITLIITNSYIFSGIRNRITNPHAKVFIICPQCIGFWAGNIGYTILYFDPFNIYFWIYATIYGGVVSLVSLIANKLVS